MIAIEMLCRIDQGLIFYFQPDRDFFRSIRIRLKIFQQTLIKKPMNIWGLRRNAVLHIWLTFRNQTLIDFFWADFDCNFFSTIRLSKFNRDHDRD
ncbi:MAG: hypothetical protein CVV32_01660 [Methanomicrobiales archaeon HGW-Methanomicrobiales-3]|nr:MAG: hypothetical protein CVV32_01660 [Methanomicrobiales archaeon HGW-Methanomicrobiales-3]